MRTLFVYTESTKKNIFVQLTLVTVSLARRRHGKEYWSPSATSQEYLRSGPPLLFFLLGRTRYGKS